MESKSQFLSTLDIRMLPEENHQRWMLLAPLYYYSKEFGRIIEVPQYFITDLVSFELLKGKAQRPAVLHDYLYACTDVDRKFADKIFEEAMDAVDVEKSLKRTMFKMVRTFGKFFREKSNKYSLNRRT